MAAIDNEIRAYEEIQRNLESQHHGCWVLMKDQIVIGIYQTAEMASTEALQRFGRGPYLIRQIGAAPLRLPVSVIVHRHAAR